jgi:hypothetical protein
LKKEQGVYHASDTSASDWYVIMAVKNRDFLVAKDCGDT